MKQFILIIAASILCLSLLSANTGNPTNPNTAINFHTGSFESGMQRAEAEGKFYFVEFYADWCTPCKWMDKTTFKNQSVVTKLNQDFVALKLDIESEEGSSLKGQYEVRMLPTILIFNAAGEIMDRVEKTLSAESMVSLLSFHENNLTPMDVTLSSYNKSPKNKSNSDKTDYSGVYNKYQNNKSRKTNFKLQVGHHVDYQAAFDQVNKLKEVFIEPIVVINDYVENTTQYNVMLGEFKTIEEAESFRKILERDFQLSSIVH